MKTVDKFVCAIVLSLLAGCSSGPIRVPVSSSEGAVEGVVSEPSTVPSGSSSSAETVDEQPTVGAAVRADHSRSQSAVDKLLSRAAKEQSVGNLVAAESSIERAIRIAPSNPQSYAQLAQLKAQQGQLHSAKQWVRKALALQPSAELRGQLKQLLEQLP
ncbi:tetratricopeptide repeat protein [Sinobacterium caligoides]|uniref:Tetratricopeptide repeat protein n=1 Tax=Sinobacterium caligoides TaxID=933926 RepID=A0A3N2DHE5_9GAMM|nr:hypothetical protein [Sinobacterium caligoides]ROR98804.1 tetratricopeptide repeat protein [Sinobacterium caligoides]